MKNLFKYAASYWKAMIAIVLILVVQAYCDLSLPAYTSDIVNVGIQQGGIEDEVPRQIATEEMEKLLLFVSEDDQQTVMDAYTEDNTSYKKEAYVLKDSVAEEENTMENLKDILQIPMMMTSGIESGSDTTKSRCPREWRRACHKGQTGQCRKECHKVNPRRNPSQCHWMTCLCLIF